jgi:hypothetical protein
VIRFNCPLCGKVLKVPAEKASRVVVCPRCDERSVAPAAADPHAGTDRDEVLSRQVARHPDETPGMFPGTSPPMRRYVVAVLAGVGVFLMLLPLLWPFLSSRQSDSASSPPWVVILAPCSMVILLAILYGHLTACPRCRKWWARTKVETEFVDREFFDRGGVPFAKSVYRTTYQCDACRHRWSVMQADEYRKPISRRHKPHCR